MDLYTSQHSPISEPDVPLPSLTSFQSPILKTEPMSAYPYTDPRPCTPQVIDTINFGVHSDLDNYGCADTRTYMSLIPAEISESTVPFLATSDDLNYEYKTPFFSMNDYMFVNNKDEGYVSPTASLHSLTPPSDITQLNVRDSANESGNSNDVSGCIYETDQSHFRVTVSSPPPPRQPARTQCVKCGAVIEVAHCFKEATGHFLCFACHMHASSFTPVQPPTEEPVQKRTRKKQSAIANARNQVCQNCECPNTTLWRRSFSGEAVCNACGLYEKLHKRKRPKSMRKDTIQTRRRKPRSKAIAEVVVSSASSSASIATTTNRVIPQPMIIPSHPPPPYSNHRYITLEEAGNYQVLPPMGSLGFLNTFPPEANFNHFPGQ